ncbi:MAG TPA: hypothetical protein VEQ85_03610 [Lacipirellulaceae bacterium]|nr:hypothetical protein [Lacipirellulaceae bacterium]
MNGRFAAPLVLLALLASVPPAAADVVVQEQTTPEGTSTIYKMTVTPAAEPVPALAHRLVLRELEVKRGNAAPYYYRALLDVPRLTKALHGKFGDEYAEWTSPGHGDPEKLRLAAAMLPESTYASLQTAATRDHSDWGWQLEELRGPDLIAFLLPEVQESRQLSRMLMLKARVALADRRFDEAIDVMRINGSLGRDVAAEPLLICKLVGVAIVAMNHEPLVELIGAPGSPNMYWALTELPEPQIPFRDAVRTELSIGFRMFPFMIDAENQEHSAAEWARLLAQGVAELGSVSNDPPLRNELQTQLSAMAVALLSYEPAKQRLVAAGMDPQRVDAMPVGQVIAIDASREYRRITDEIEKWSYLPHREAAQEFRGAWRVLESSRLHGGYGALVAWTLVPGIEAARKAEVRLQWQHDALRIVEAIRMHAAATGKFPATLAEIEIVPIPQNPATGEPYDYQLDGETAVLELPFSDGMGRSWRFEITLARP